MISFEESWKAESWKGKIQKLNKHFKAFDPPNQLIAN